MRYHRGVPAFFVENFGCRATQADGAALERQFEERGLSRAASPAHASVVILNTCTVTPAQIRMRALRSAGFADRIRTRGSWLPDVTRNARRRRSRHLPGVDLVIGNSHKHQLAEIAFPTSRRPTENFNQLRVLWSGLRRNRVN